MAPSVGIRGGQTNRPTPCILTTSTADRGEYRQAAGVVTQAVIRSVELICFKCGSGTVSPLLKRKQRAVPMRYLEWDGSLASRSRSYSASDMPSGSGSVCAAAVTTTVIEAEARTRPCRAPNREQGVGCRTLREHRHSFSVPRTFREEFTIEVRPHRSWS